MRRVVFSILSGAYLAFGNFAVAQIGKAALVNGSERLTAAAYGYSGSFTTSYGQKLGPESSEASLTFEPKLTIPLNLTRALDFSMIVNRPTDPHQNFALPRTAVTYSQVFPFSNAVATSYYLSLNALDLERWKVDGHRIRHSFGLEMGREVFKNVAVSLRTGPFLQWNRYSQTADGRSLPWGGLYERLKLTWTAGDFLVDVRLILNQSHAGFWRNDYATYESLGYRVLPGVTLGIAHELLSSAIDDSTGLARPTRVFDGRDSRVSLLLELEI